jgi:hypothetical protein
MEAETEVGVEVGVGGGSGWWEVELGVEVDVEVGVGVGVPRGRCGGLRTAYRLLCSNGLRNWPAPAGFTHQVGMVNGPSLW